MPLRKNDLVQVEEIKSGRGIPKITLVKVVNDMLIKEVTKSINLDRIKWWRRINMTDSD